MFIPFIMAYDLIIFIIVNYVVVLSEIHKKRSFSHSSVTLVFISGLKSGLKRFLTIAFKVLSKKEAGSKPMLMTGIYIGVKRSLYLKP